MWKTQSRLVLRSGFAGFGATREWWALFHQGLIGSHSAPPVKNIEFWAGQRFRLRAPAYAIDVPGWDDHVSWLLLAQHYGVPTRLPDWTENVLVGLYFAATGGDQLDDGELWCMNHSELNWRSANWAACFPDTPLIRYLAVAAFLKPDGLARFEVELGETKINGPLALIPPLQFPRMAAQMSRFLPRGDSLVRYIVPVSAKADLARQLSRIGFSHENLHRSLDSLARSIREEIVEPDFDILQPPRFGGTS